MSDQFGYNQQYTDKPGMWDIDGYAVCVDGYGTLQIQVNRVLTTGVLAPVLQTAPSSAVSAIVQSASNSGVYHINLVQTWVELDMACIVTAIPSSLLAGQPIMVQVEENTVGNVGFGPGQALPQAVKFTTLSPMTGDVISLPKGAGLFFHLRLQNVST